jgi:hypothetical protein
MNKKNYLYKDKIIRRGITLHYIEFKHLSSRLAPIIRRGKFLVSEEKILLKTQKAFQNMQKLYKRKPKQERGEREKKHPKNPKKERTERPLQN